MRIRSLILSVILLVVSPCAALAHSALLGSDPQDGAVLKAAPPAVTLTFSEPVSPLAFRWITPDGLVQDLPPASVQSRNGIVTVTPPERLARGSQALSWRVASPDGHPVGGTLGFAIGAASGAVADGPADTALPAAVARWALTVALVFGVGGAIFTHLVAAGICAPGTKRTAIWASALTVPLAVLATGLHGADMLGQGAASLAGEAPWVAVAGAGFARTAGLAALAALLALAALKAQGTGGKVLALIGWGVAALSFIASGHATTPVKAVALALHALTLIFWIGALPGLAFALAHARAALPLLLRFSALAVPLVLVLIGSGIAMTLAEARSLSDIVNTACGRLLLAKLGLVAAMLGLAALNRQRLTPSLATGGSAAPLARSIRAELCLAVLVLALASGFRLTGTPAATAPALAGPMVHIHTEQAMATLTLTNARFGENTLTVDLADGDFGPIDPQAAEASLGFPAAGIEKIRLNHHRVSQGHWASDPFNLPLPGTWDIALRLRTGDFTSLALSSTVDIAP